MERIEFFRSFGFSEYESQTLAAFSRLKAATAKDISTESGVPQNKLYSILSNFEKLGIVSQVPSDKKFYKLINLKSFVAERLKEKEDSVGELKKYSASLETADEANEVVFSLIRGQQAIIRRLGEQNVNVEKEILGVQRNWKLTKTNLDSMRLSIKRKVKVKLIGIINEETKERALAWKKIGCEVRAYNDQFGPSPLRFTVFDGKEARITIGKPEIQNPEDYITVWTKSKPFVQLLRSQFNTMWAKSKPL